MTFSVTVTALIFLGAIVFTLGLGAASAPLVYLAGATFLAAGVVEMRVRRPAMRR